MNAAPEISVIIPHYNGEEILRDCLESLRKTTIPLEIILVDNASTDNSPSVVAVEFPHVKILSLPENLGFAGGCNAGIKEATSPFVLILNNDTIHEEQWIEKLLNKIRSDPDVAIVQPKLLSYQNRRNFDYSGAMGGEIDVFGFPFARGRIFEYIEEDTNQYDKLNDRIFWASGTAFLARKDVLLQAGLFDEIFFAHMEEIDLQWRIHLMGYSVVVEADSVIYHRSGFTLGAESPFKKYLNHRNALFMFLSNYRAFTTLYLFLPRIALDYLAIFFSLLRFDTGRMYAIVKAHIWNLLHIGAIIKKRCKVNRLRVRKDREIFKLMYHGSIALSSFLLGKKKYSDFKL